jgi:hypothetical protein
MVWKKWKEESTRQYIRLKNDLVSSKNPLKKMTCEPLLKSEKVFTGQEKKIVLKEGTKFICKEKMR